MNPPIQSTTFSAAVKSDTPSRSAGLGAALRAEVSENRLALILCAVFVIAANVALDRAAGDTPNFFHQLPTSLLLNAAMMFYIGLLQLCAYLVAKRPESPFKSVWTAFHSARAQIFARAIIFFPLAVLVISTFAHVKQNIGPLNPFWLDDTLIRLDAVLHGGWQPWQLIQPLVVHYVVTDALDYLYYSWFPILYLTFFWQVFRRRDPALRRQYLLSFFACWILIGCVGAFVLSSAGPAFLHDLKLNSRPFDGLISYLDHVNQLGHPLNALAVQDTLWKAYVTDFSFPYEGISAMPSMHVAIATLMALLGWRIGRIAGIAYSVFAMLIFVGSIHLGFHYAVDGYVAALMTFAIWFVAGRLTRRAPSQPPAPPPHDADALMRARMARLMMRPA